MSRKILGIFLFDVGLGYPYTFKYSHIVQLVEHLTVNQGVVGSSPTVRAIKSMIKLTIKEDYSSGEEALLLRE